MSSFNLICDNCGRLVQGVTWMNGMKFCAKCYQETFGNKNTTENLNNMYEAYLKILNEKDQRIAELEEELKNAIMPKFKIGQEVWYVWNKSQVIPFKCKIENIVYDSSKNYKLKYDSEHYICMQEEHLFATKEEAQAKLEELQGENK